MIHSMKRMTKALIRLRGCAGWSVPLLFTNIEKCFSRAEVHTYRVANVRHSHVILTIRNTQTLDSGKKLICVSRIHYIAKNGTAQNPALESSFICMSHLFMKFRHLRDYSSRPCFFREYGTHTLPSVSQNMTKLNKRGLLKQ